MLKDHNRFNYSGISTRPSFEWPGGKRIAFYIALNIEHFPFGEGGGIDLDRETKPWSQRSWLWREYGNRVGGWRLADLFDDLEMNVGVIVNAANYSHSPELLERYRNRGDEMIGHGISNGTTRPIDMTIEEETRMVAEVTEIMTKADGKRPNGWLSSYLTPSQKTPDILSAAGYEYLLDWGLCDEQPFWMKTDNGEILTLPYPLELNDQPAIVGRRVSAEEYANMIIDQFDVLMDLNEPHPLVFPLSLHSFIVGQPFRQKHLKRALNHIRKRRDEIWITTPNEVSKFYRQLPLDKQLRQ